MGELVHSHVREGNIDIVHYYPVPVIESREYKPGDIVVPREMMGQRIQELSEEIATYFKDKNLVILATLKGGAFFAVHLAEALYEAGLTDSEIEFMATTSYGSEHASSGNVRISQDLPDNVDLAGRHVLLVDDVQDTGRNLKFMREEMVRRGAQETRAAIAVAKPFELRQVISPEPDWIGFHAPGIWLDGGGMNSWGGLFRGNPDIIAGPNPIYIPNKK